MILLNQVSHSVPTPNGQRWILKEQSIIIGDLERIGIFAQAGEGKTTLARLLSGIETPESGSIHLKGDTSWPVGLAGIIHPDLTIRQNIETIAALVSVDPSTALSVIADFSQNTLDKSRIAKTLSPNERALFAYSLSFIKNPQHYIFDEKIVIGSRKLQAEQERILEDRFRTSGLIFVSRNWRLLRKYCARFYAMTSGTLNEIEPSQTKILEAANV